MPSLTSPLSQSAGRAGPGSTRPSRWVQALGGPSGRPTSGRTAATPGPTNGSPGGTVSDQGPTIRFLSDQKCKFCGIPIQFQVSTGAPGQSSGASDSNAGVRTQRRRPWAPGLLPETLSRPRAAGVAVAGQAPSCECAQGGGVS